MEVPTVPQTLPLNTEVSAATPLKVSESYTDTTDMTTTKTTKTTTTTDHLTTQSKEGRRTSVISTVTTTVDVDIDSESKPATSDLTSHDHHHFHHHESTFKSKLTVWEADIKHDEHEVHVFSKNLVKDIEADKAKYEADGALIVKGSASVVSGDVLGGGVPIAEGALELVGAFVKDAAEAFVQTKEGEAKDPSAVANSKAVKAALTAERVLDNIAKDVDPLAKGITEIVKGDVVGGAEALTQVTAQIGADVVVPVVDAVSGPNSVIASEVDKLAPELVKDVGAAANSIGSIVQKKTAAGVGSLVDTLQQVDTDVSGAKTVPVAAVPAAASASPATSPAASATVTKTATASVTVSASTTVTTATSKSDQDIVDVTHSVVDIVDRVKAAYGTDSVTTHEIERLAVLMLRQLLSASSK
ncbi:hypothetical protein HK100_003809 [Physocladia obscura]|uniref:Uncharacterized protein n=1 Tax=Physocladia obscura TaxID=109957 RepID=A0AAD5TCJ4_9FUNG|nr:hypothetical protein HK100_003809 [Physocladia obscura]